MPAEMLLDLTRIDLNRVIFTQEEIHAHNPHRHEMCLLDGIVHFDPATMDAVGYHDLKPDAFWVRGHVPGMPIFPGALMIESAAQLASFCYRKRFGTGDGRFFGFGGIDKVKFRSMAVPGQRLYVVCREIVLNRRFSRFSVQGVVEGQPTFDGEIVGVSMPMRAALPRGAEAGS